MPDIHHWADSIAEQVVARLAQETQLKKQADEHGIIVMDEKTPSGTIHVGAGRGWVIHDCVAKALRQRGLKARFLLSADDYDPFDKPSKELGPDWDQHLGKPFRDMPSPVEGYESYADYYFSQVTDKFAEWGIDAELHSTGAHYLDGSFNTVIRKVLDEAPAIQNIYADLYGDDVAMTKKLPINIKCPQCGKIATTIATAWDPEKEEVTYSCQDGVVSFASGCGSSGTISPYNGNAKLPWKVEWAAKWPTFKVIYETAGKDHHTKKGSRTVACRIAVDVFTYPPPLPSDGYKEGKGYEFFHIGGKKMSTSKGLGMGFSTMTQYAPAKVLRYLMVRTRPTTVIDFDPTNEHAMLLLFDQYDTAEQAYFAEDGDPNQKRIYELSHVGPIPSRCPPQVSLTTAAHMMQITLFDEESAMAKLMDLKVLPSDMTDEEKALVKERLQYAAHWVKDFSSEQFQFTVHEHIPDEVKNNLSQSQKASLLTLAGKLGELQYNAEELGKALFALKDEHQLSTREFFEGAYLAIIGKKKGPKLAGFILTIGQEKVKALLETLA